MSTVGQQTNDREGRIDRIKQKSKQIVYKNVLHIYFIYPAGHLVWSQRDFLIIRTILIFNKDILPVQSKLCICVWYLVTFLG